MINKVLQGLRWVEEALLALLLAGMIGLAAWQVIMRNFFESGIYWGDSAVRVAVLWIAMLGAMVASRDNNHIKIDFITRLVPVHTKPWIERGVALFTCALLFLFAWSSMEFVQYEYEDGTIAFASVPAWLCEAIIPFGSLVMAIRYGLLTIRPTS